MFEASPTVFDVHQWVMPATTCDYPVLAVAQDQSAVLSLGDYSLAFDWGIPEEAEPWLKDDFARTEQTLQCDISTMRALLASTFAGGVEFGTLTFDEDLRPTGIQFALANQEEAEAVAEYRIQGAGNYLRYYREPERLVPVTAAERIMLDVCVATFTEIAARHAILVRQPPPPRYRGGGAKGGVEN